MGKRKATTNNKPLRIRKPTAAQIRKALEGSIRKWEKIVAACSAPEKTDQQLVAALDKLEKGTANCPLCRLFGHTRNLTKQHHKSLVSPGAQIYVEFGSCWLCPVYTDTRQEDCEGTPYAEFSHQNYALRGDGDAGFNEIKFVRSRLRIYARSELSYLKALLRKWDRAHRTNKRAIKPTKGG